MPEPTLMLELTVAERDYLRDALELRLRISQVSSTTTAIRKLLAKLDDLNKC